MAREGAPINISNEALINYYLKDVKIFKNVQKYKLRLFHMEVM